MRDAGADLAICLRERLGDLGGGIDDPRVQDIVFQILSSRTAERLEQWGDESQ